MPVSHLSPPPLESDAAHPDGFGTPTGTGATRGQVFADLLLLGTLSCQTPAALLSVPQGTGGWATLSHGFDRKDGLNDRLLLDAIAATTAPIEFADLVTSLPRSPLVQPPNSMRWAYGAALRDQAGSVVGVVAVLDRWLRQVTKREQRAMGALSRQLTEQLAQFRANGAKGPSRAMAIEVQKATPIAAAAGTSRSLLTLAGLGAEPPQLLRSHEVASIFDVTERTVINWAAAGKLPSLRTIGGHLRFRRDDVLSLLAGSEDRAARP